MPKLTLTLAALAALVAVAIYSVDRTQRASTDAPPAIASAAGRIDAATCAECHPGIAQRFESAPHHRTLWRGDYPQIIAAFDGKSVELAGQTIRFYEAAGELWSANSALPFARRVDWVFGSGQHAMTPASIDHDPQGHPRLTQFHASLLAGGQLGPTPGTELAGAETNHTEGRGTQPPSDAPLASPGIISDAADTRRCFGCHVSYLPEPAGRIDLSQATLGIDCTRCHPGAKQHAASGGDIAVAMDWAELSPLQSINRCGECHRRADEFTPDELDPAFTHLIRFAPVGMAMSPCFQGSQLPPPAADATNDAASSLRFPRFDCVTCHDPHEPASTEPEHYNVSCRQCHVSPQPAAAPAPEPKTHRTTSSCTAAPQDSSCIECHMPKISTGDGLDFTDHWIRKRR